MINFNNFIQIAGIIDKAEAKMLINNDVQFLGFPLRLPVHKEDLSEETAAEIIKSLSPPNYGVLITYLDKASDIKEFCDFLGAKIVQLHGEISLEEIKKLKLISPDLKLIKSLVVKPNNKQKLLEETTILNPFIDAFITDTFDPETGASGATGKTHDWSVSKQLIAISEKPVILAGGLNADNVFDAIIEVKPAGVDSHTGVEDSSGRKDETMIRKFVEDSKRAFSIINK